MHLEHEGLLDYVKIKKMCVCLCLYVCVCVCVYMNIFNKN